MQLPFDASILILSFKFPDALILALPIAGRGHSTLMLMLVLANVSYRAPSAFRVLHSSMEKESYENSQHSKFDKWSPQNKSCAEQ